MNHCNYFRTDVRNLYPFRRGSEEWEQAMKSLGYPVEIGIIHRERRDELTEFLDLNRSNLKPVTVEIIKKHIEAAEVKRIARVLSA